MFTFAMRRLLRMAVTALGVSILVFLLMHLAPGDPAEAIAIARLGVLGVTQADINRLRVEEGLDRGLVEQYSSWLSHVSHGDFGLSLAQRRTVASLLREHVSSTIALAVTASALALLLAIPIGVESARRPGSVLDRSAAILSSVGAATPAFCTGLALILIFGLWLRWLPIAGSQRTTSIVLPVLTLAISLGAWNLRLLRIAMGEVLSSRYILAARARGIPEYSIGYRHALRNAGAALIPLVAAQLLAVLEGTVVIETLFAWPGIGRMLSDAVLARDFPVIQACALLFGTAAVVISTGADLLGAAADPRQRTA